MTVDIHDFGLSEQSQKNYAHWKGANQPESMPVNSNSRVLDEAANKAKLRTLESNTILLASSTVPLPQLVRQLLKNFSQQSLTALRNIANKSENEFPGTTMDPGLQLLLRFQRLLLIRLYSEESPIHPATTDLLLKYISWLCDHSAENLQACSSLLEQQNSLSLMSFLMTVMRNSVVGKSSVEKNLLKKSVKCANVKA